MFLQLLALASLQTVWTHFGFTCLLVKRWNWSSCCRQTSFVTPTGFMWASVSAVAVEGKPLWKFHEGPSFLMEFIFGRFCFYHRFFLGVSAVSSLCSASRFSVCPRGLSSSLTSRQNATFPPNAPVFSIVHTLPFVSVLLCLPSLSSSLLHLSTNYL